MNDAIDRDLLKPKRKRRAKSGDTIAAQMATVAGDLARLESTAHQLRERQKALELMREQQGAKRIGEAMLRHRYGDVTDAQTAALAKRVAPLAVLASLEKLS